MPKLLRSALAIALIVCAIGAALWAAKLSHSYQECDASYKHGYAYPENANSQQERARRFIVCEGAFFDANKEAITAGATIAIAVFTLVLWLATGRQAEISSRLA